MGVAHLIYNNFVEVIVSKVIHRPLQIIHAEKFTLQITNKVNTVVESMKTGYIRKTPLYSMPTEAVES